MTRPVVNDYDLTTPTGQAAWGADVYRHGAEGLDVQDDQDAREALDNSAHTVKTNAQLATGLNHTTNALGVPSYTGGNRVTVAANRAGVDMMPEDAQNTEDLEQEVKVGAAVQAGTIFTTGGFIGAAYAGSAGPYADGAFLAEASKQTGEKFF